MTPRPPACEAGELVGQTLDGRLVSGHAVVADRQPEDGRAELMVFRGTGDLDGPDDPES